MPQSHKFYSEASLVQSLGAARAEIKKRGLDFDAEHGASYRSLVDIETFFETRPQVKPQSFEAKHPLFRFEDTPTDDQLVEKFKRASRIYLFGMGGSALPLRTLLDFFDLGHKACVIDSLDPRFYRGLFDSNDALYCFVSKSGSTLELKAMLAEVVARQIPSERILVVTGPQESFFRSFAKEQSTHLYDIPTEIGGRFTHFIPFHQDLLRALNAPIDITLKGAREMRDRLLAEPYILEELYLQAFDPKKACLLLWSYGEDFVGFTAWAQQVLAESLGKQRSDGARVGVLPVDLKGPQDQHSVLQLLMDGPQDKVVWFFNTHRETPQKESRSLPASLEFFEENGLDRITKILSESTIETFRERLGDEETAQPFACFGSDGSAKDLGAMICLMDAFVEYAAKRLDIDAFDQPGVERGKEIARGLMRDLASKS